MRLLPLLTALLFTFIVSTCDSRPNDVEGAGVDTPPEAGVDRTPNDGNLDIYDVDPEDPYLLSNRTLLGLKPGEPIAPYTDALRKGKLKTGEGNFAGYYIDGAEGGELGFMMPDTEDETLIGDIYIFSPSVVTEEGIRVGLSYSELTERLGAIDFYGSEIESRVYGEHEGLRYQLDINSNTPEKIAAGDIPASTKVKAIVINR